MMARNVRFARYHRVAAVSLTVATVIAAFVLIAAIGNRQAAQGQRVFAQLDTPIEFLRVSGGAVRDWALAHAVGVGWVTTAVGSTIALAGVVLGGGRAAPLLLLAVAMALATWGEVLLLTDHTALGASCYGASVICAFGLGIWCPMPPVFNADAGSGSRAAGDDRRIGLECVCVGVLTIAALLSRVYALTELPNFFEAEMSVSMLASRTWAGLYEYVPSGLSGNSNGLMHLLPQMLSFRVLGTSIYSLRLVSVAFGVVAVPVFYLLLRRIAGPLVGLIGGALLVTAPDQLFWSRDENTMFIPLTVLAIVTVYLGLRMVERVGFARVLVAALWMPIGRYFYLPGMVLLVYPLLLYAHALVFVRGTWRSLWYAVPLMAGGVMLWIVSLTMVNAAVHEWKSGFVSPTGNIGAAIWEGENQLRTTSIPARALLSAVAVGRHLGAVVSAMTYRGGFSQWYQRADPSKHPTITNIGVVVMVALGLGYLLGQLYDQRAFALLLWVGLGLLPGILSLDPATRRIGLVFPGMYAIAAVTLGAFVQLIRDRGGRVLASFGSVAMTVALLGIIWTSVASHFELPIGPPFATKLFRFTQPLFEGSDAIFHDVDPTMALLLVFGNADRFLEPGKTPCLRHVNPREWLSAALQQRCAFTDTVHQFTASDIERAALAAAYHPQRVSFLLRDEPSNDSYIELLRGLYPRAVVRATPPTLPEVKLVALTIARSDVEALHVPELSGSEETTTSRLAARLLRGVRLTPTAANAPGGATVSVRAGLLLEGDGWYRFGLTPACAGTTITIDRRAVTPSDVLPLLAGVHALDITLPNADACVLPLEFSLDVQRDQHLVALKPVILLAPAAAAVPQAHAPTVALYGGYGAAQQFSPEIAAVVDFGVDSEEAVTVLLQDGAGFEVRRFAPDGHELARWKPKVPRGQTVWGLMVAMDGTSFVISPTTTLVYDRSGSPIAVWNDPPVWTSEVAALPDGRVLSCVPHHAAVAVLRPDGTVEREWARFEGGPGRFSEPMSVRVQGQEVLVLQSDHQALLFHNPLGEFGPVFVRSFPLSFTTKSVYPRGAAFDGPERIVVPDPGLPMTLVYGVDGQRLMAADPARDVNNRGFGDIVRLVAMHDHLYVLDGARRLWRLAR
jgi:hypothetical protein